MRYSRTIRTALSLTAVAVLVLTGGVFVASNMGFKIDCTLQAAQAGVSLSGSNFVGLPYNQQLSLTTAKDWFVDMLDGGGSPQFINQHRKIDDLFEVYTFGGGTIPPTGWQLVSGECYIVKVATTQTYMIVGTHDPSLAITFMGPGVGSISGPNFYQHPYHGVAATARDLFQEIGGSIQFINQHRKIDDLFEVYTFGGGTIPPNGWMLDHNECYIVKVGNTVIFTPAHY